MSAGSVLCVMDLDCAAAVTWMTNKVSQAGLAVIRTFDLQTTRYGAASCPCPQHGTDACDCQMVVLLVYQDHHQPLSLVAHGYDGQTWFSVVSTPEQRPDPALEQLIHGLLRAPLNYSR
jgi:hypothetical protein